MTTDPTITVADALTLHGDDNVTFVDVREPAEIAQGSIAGAAKIPRGTLPDVLADLNGPLSDTSRTYVFYCAAGARASHAAQTAQAFGLQNIRVMETGYTNWKGAGGPTE